MREERSYELRRHVFLTSLSLSRRSFRRHLKAKMNWKGAGNKVKLAVALSSEVRHVDQGEDRIELVHDEETLKRMKEEEEEMALKAAEVKPHVLGCSYADAMIEALTFNSLDGKKWRTLMEEADEQAEIIMERMREQSLLTDVSEQVLIKHNTVAKQVRETWVGARSEATKRCEYPSNSLTLDFNTVSSVAAVEDRGSRRFVREGDSDGGDAPDSRVGRRVQAPPAHKDAVGGAAQGGEERRGVARSEATSREVGFTRCRRLMPIPLHVTSLPLTPSSFLTT